MKSYTLRLLFIAIGVLLFFIPCLGQGGLDDRINDAFMPLAIGWENLVFSSVSIGGTDIPIVLIVLISCATWFTLYFKFINVRMFGTAIRVVRGNYDFVEEQIHTQDIQGTIKDESVHGEVNHFQALTTAVSGTVGLGNISMVAVAITIGGPGATFWMVLAGLLGMSTKFVECTLGVKYREIGPDGQVYGGPSQYLLGGLRKRGWGGLGRMLSVVFAILCVGASFGGGNAFQSNQAAAQIIQRLDLDASYAGTAIGAIMALCAGVVIMGGIKSIGKATSKLVPLMAAIYVVSALIILIMNGGLIDDAIGLIMTEAFSPQASIAGGISGVIIQGFRRAAFSNEAGAGSAAIAHAAVKTKYPASEGLVALLEPFIDTVVICTMTALVIIIFNMDGHFEYGDVINNEVQMLSGVRMGERVGGVNVTSLAFEHSLPGFSYILVIAVALFAFSTIISWSYYGIQSWKFLFGKSRMADLSYKMVYLIFTVLGAAVTLDAVIKFSDAMILALVFPNMVGLLILFKDVDIELSKYMDVIRKR